MSATSGVVVPREVGILLIHAPFFKVEVGIPHDI